MVPLPASGKPAVDGDSGPLVFFGPMSGGTLAGGAAGIGAGAARLGAASPCGCARAVEVAKIKTRRSTGTKFFITAPNAQLAKPAELRDSWMPAPLPEFTSATHTPA
jgi:hypothetical protein